MGTSNEKQINLGKTASSEQKGDAETEAMDVQAQNETLEKLFDELLEDESNPKHKSSLSHHDESGPIESNRYFSVYPSTKLSENSQTLSSTLLNPDTVSLKDTSDSYAEDNSVETEVGIENRPLYDRFLNSITTLDVNPGSMERPVLSNFGGSYFNGGSVILTTAMLSASDYDTSDTRLVYEITSSVSSGRLESTTNAGVSITRFTQADLAAGHIRYIHDGSGSLSDGFAFTLTDGITRLSGNSFNLSATTLTAAMLDISSAATENSAFELISPAPAVDDYFGEGIYISGNYALISAIGVSNSQGAAYLYDTQTGTLIHTFTSSAPNDYDYYGWDTYIKDNYIIIAQPYSDVQTTNSGIIEVFDLTTQNLLYTIYNPTPAASDWFGGEYQVINNYIFVTHGYDDTGASNAGTLFMYDLATGNLLRTFNNPFPAANDYFSGSGGNNIQILGNTLLVGSHSDSQGATDAGRVYAFNLTTGALLYSINNPAPQNTDNFGRSIYAYDHYVFISCDFDNFGAADAGSGYIYDTNTGTLLYTINNPTPAASDRFTLSVRGVDNYVYVYNIPQNNGDVSLYVYDITNGSLVYTITSVIPTTNDPSSIQDIYNDYLIFYSENDSSGINNSGTMHILDRFNGALVATIENPSPLDWGAFGATGNAFSDTKMVIGAGNYTGYDSGDAYVYFVDFDEDGIVTGDSLDNTMYGLDGNDTLTGGAGADILFGGTGADRFIFEATSAFTEVDRIEDFNAAQGDIIDISDVLAGYVDGVSYIADFVQFVDNGLDSIMAIDADGAVNGVNFIASALIIGGAGLDAVTLYNSGNLDLIV